MILIISVNTVACVAGVEGEGKGKIQCAKPVKPSSSPPNTPALILTLSFPFYGLPRRLIH